MTQDQISTALGTIGTVCWCVQLLPQIWTNWRRKDCTGFPPLMMFLWMISVPPMAAYFVVERSALPIEIQPHLFFTFSIVAFVQSLYYPPVAMRPAKIAAIVAATVAVCAGVEVGLILGMRPLNEAGIRAPVLAVGVVASVLLTIGLLPPYVELWYANGRAIGFNFAFLAMDSCGAIFSLASVAVEEGDLDIIGVIVYSLVLALEFGIFFSHMIWKLRVKFFGLRVDPLPLSETESEKALCQDISI